MFLRHALAAVVIAGCGSDAPAAADAGCIFGPWSEPTPVVELNSPAPDNDPDLSSDGLTMLLTRPSAAGDLDVWIATRASGNAPWGQPALLVGGVNSPANERNPHQSADGLRVYLDADDAGTFDLYVATRPDKASSFGPRVALGGSVNNSMFDQFSAALPADEGFIMYSSSESGGRDLWTATAAGAGAFTSPIRVVELSDPVAGDGAPWLSADGLRIYFASARTGGPGPDDLWEASRASLADPFSAPSLMSVSSPYEEDDPTLSVDGSELYFVSTRPGGAGATDIWRATRTCQ